MKKLLTNKVALVTGGTRGIGKAIGTSFARQGASLALFGINPERGAQIVNELSKEIGADQKVHFYPVDVSNTEPTRLGIEKVYADFGQIDILVNNAGVTRDQLLMKMKEEEWDCVVDTNLKSLYNTCHPVIRQMMKARSGKIINITSVVGLIGNPGQTNYAASKAGMIGFTKSLARELGSRGINVNCIAPGFIKSDMTAVLTDLQKENLLNQIPLKSLGEPEDIAHAALFLASEYARYITGQVLTVDGGMVMS